MFQINTIFASCLALASISSVMPLQAYKGNCSNCDRDRDYYNDYREYRNSDDYDNDDNEEPRYRRRHNRVLRRDDSYKEGMQHPRESYRMNEQDHYTSMNDEADYREFSDNYNDNDGTVDQDLAKRIQNKFSSHFVNGKMNVEVNNGVVQLQGIVKTWDDKEKLEKEIRNMDGVKGLTSQLKVQEREHKSQRKEKSYL